MERVRDRPSGSAKLPVSRAWLEELTARCDGETAIAFSAGLHARGEQRAEAAERHWERAWRRLLHKRVDLRGPDSTT